MPSLAAIILDQTTDAPRAEDELAGSMPDLEEEYRKTMY